MREDFIDGLRGMFCLIVINNHFINAFYPYFAGDNEFDFIHEYQEKYSIWRTTPLRILFSGTFSVMMFFVLSGVSLSWKAHKISVIDLSFYEKIRISWLKRYTRLLIPVFFASWAYHIFYRLGLFSYADDAFIETQSYWLNRYSLVWTAEGCKKFTAFGYDILSVKYFLYETLILVWTYREPRYCVAFWPLSLFLFGSFLVYTILANVSSIYSNFGRYFLYVIIIIGILEPNWNNVYQYSVMNAFNGVYSTIPFFVLGVLLSDIRNKTLFYNTYREYLGKQISEITGLLFFAFGIFLGSYPYFIQQKVFPKTWEFLYENYYIRFNGYTYVFFMGSMFCMFGIFFSKILTVFFSIKILTFLGKISYELYLFHNLWLFSICPVLFMYLKQSNAYFTSFILVYFIGMICIIIFSWLFHKILDFITEKITNFLIYCIFEENFSRFIFNVKKFIVDFIHNYQKNFGILIMLVFGIILCFITPVNYSETCLVNVSETLLLKNNKNLMHSYELSTDSPAFNLINSESLGKYTNIRPLFKHYYCDQKSIITSREFFDFSSVEDWNANCTTKTDIFSGIMIPDISKISLLFLSHTISDSNLRGLYSHILWYNSKIQDQVINFKEKFNTAYQTELLGYTWISPLPGGTPRPCRIYDKVFC